MGPQLSPANAKRQGLRPPERFQRASGDDEDFGTVPAAAQPHQVSALLGHGGLQGSSPTLTLSVTSGCSRARSRGEHSWGGRRPRPPPWKSYVGGEEERNRLRNNKYRIKNPPRERVTGTMLDWVAGEGLPEKTSDVGPEWHEAVNKRRRGRKDRAPRRAEARAGPGRAAVPGARASGGTESRAGTRPCRRRLGTDGHQQRQAS